MKKEGIACIFLFFTLSIFAEIPQEDFQIWDKYKEININLGDEFSKVVALYPGLVFKGERKYSNISYKEYGYNGISFFISSYAESESHALILGIEVSSKDFALKTSVSIESTKQEVITAFGEADYIRENEFYYQNTEFDHMELVFRFNEKDVVDFIELFSGT